MSRHAWLAAPLVAALLAGFVLPIALLVAGAVRGDARLATARTLPDELTYDRHPTILDGGPAWRDVDAWGAPGRALGAGSQRLAPLDHARGATGKMRQVPAHQRASPTVILRSVATAASVTFATLLLGYPAAALIATSRRGTGPLLLCVLVPLWTSTLVRAAAWMVLLARQGVVSASLLSLGLIGAPLEVLHHRAAVLIAMTNILLPYMILPLVAIMRDVPAATMRAAASLGASPLTMFRRVWLPQTYPGIAAGTLMVFVQALGAYVAPALLGGATDQMLPWFIGAYADRGVDGGAIAGLLLVLLLVIALVITLVFLAGKRFAAGLLALR